MVIKMGRCNIEVIALDLDGTLMYNSYTRMVFSDALKDASNRTGRRLEDVKWEFERLNERTMGTLKYFDWNWKFKVLGSRLTFEELIVKYRHAVEGKVYEDVHPFLEAVKGRYRLICATNGFKSIQTLKLSIAGIKDYFWKIFTADQCGDIKPHIRFFQALIEEAGEEAESIMFVDDLLDIAVEAGRTGMISVWLDRKGNFHGRMDNVIAVNRLTDLISMLR